MFARADALACSRINFMPAHPFMQGLGHAANLGLYGLDGSPQGRVLATVIVHAAYSAFAHF